jgi:hypothetical protein
MKGSETVRHYAVAIALLVFFVAWASIAAHPWTGPEPVRPPDTRAETLAAREARLTHKATVVRRVLDRRWATYRHQLAGRLTQIERVTDRRRDQVLRSTQKRPPVVVQISQATPLTWTQSS